MFKGKIVLRSNIKWHRLSFWTPIFRILSRLGSQDGPMLETKTDPKSIKNRCEKRWIFEGLLEGHNFGKFWILEANMGASWHQNQSRNRCYLRKAVFWKNIVFLQEKHTFLTYTGSKLGAKNDQKSIKIWSPRWGASWHRFLIDFLSILVDFCKSKKASRNGCQKEGD